MRAARLRGREISSLQVDPHKAQGEEERKRKGLGEGRRGNDKAGQTESEGQKQTNLAWSDLFCQRGLE